jgi:hypothetical protein
LYENAQYYSSHPTVRLLHEKGAFTSIKTAFAMCLSDSALSVFETQSLVAAVIEEAQLNAQNFKFSSIMCMFALATVINCRIESYYPVGKDLSPREEWDSLEKMFNSTIFPKHHCDGEHIEDVNIFRCAVMPQQYLVDRHVLSIKNHFVALCQLSNNIELEPGEHYFLPQQPASTSTSNSSTGPLPWM